MRRTEALQVLVKGQASGSVLGTRMPLSFWGGVNPDTGTIIDIHHDLCGEDLTGKVLVMPSGRGSCTASVVLLECIIKGHAPCAVVLQEADEIIALGVILADELYSKSIPVCVVDAVMFDLILSADTVDLTADGKITLRHPSAEENGGVS